MLKQLFLVFLIILGLSECSKIKVSSLSRSLQFSNFLRNITISSLGIASLNNTIRNATMPLISSLNNTIRNTSSVIVTNLNDTARNTSSMVITRLNETVTNVVTNLNNTMRNNTLANLISSVNNTMTNNSNLNNTVRNDSMSILNTSITNNSMRNDSIIERNNSISTTPIMPTFIKDFCPIKNNCLFYGVETQLDKYDCLVCNKEYMLVYDSQGRASCEEKNTLPNCDKSMKRSDRNYGKPFCFRCEKDYVLKSETECEKLPTDKKVMNCRDYHFSDNLNKCMNCEQGFYLDEMNNKCENGCRIPNCETCKMINSQEYCEHCLPNMIGIFDSKTTSFKNCMTCNEYQSQLKSANSTYIPRF
jgi:hypothetical protein